MTPTDYLNLWNGCTLTPSPTKLAALDSIVKVALLNQILYQTVQRFVSIPWPVIAAIHFRESDQHFRCHLHNGDPLSARTTHVPVGRPEKGVPPFTWIESAVDALDDVWLPPNWTIAGALECLERYNGTGYQKHGVNTPYVWDFTNQYTAGLYVADGSFDAVKTESRPGAAALLKALEAKGVNLDFSALVSGDCSLH